MAEHISGYGRQGTARFSRIMSSSTADIRTRINRLSEQLSGDGMRVLQPSDDVVASARNSQVQSENTVIAQYQKNNQSLQISFGAQEKEIQTIQDQLKMAGARLAEAATDTNSDQDMLTHASNLDYIIDSIFSQLNAKAGGSYLFSGTKNDKAPVVYDSSTQSYSYAGNAEYREVSVAQDVTLKANVHLYSAFSTTGGNDMNILTKLKQLSENMKDTTKKKSDYQNDIQALLDLTSKARDDVSGTVTELGYRTNMLELLDDVQIAQTNANNQLSTHLVGLTEDDKKDKILELTQQESALQTSFLIYSKINRISLFDYIR